MDFEVINISCDIKMLMQVAASTIMIQGPYMASRINCEKVTIIHIETWKNITLYINQRACYHVTELLSLTPK